MGRVLLVEDEPNIASIIIFKLRREGHVVVHVEAGTEALAIAGDWDLVILDSSLPGEEPIALLTRFRRIAPVAVMTESQDRSTGPLALAAGAAAVVSKPFKPTVLARLVAEISAGKSDSNHRAATADRGLMTDVVGPR